MGRLIESTFITLDGVIEDPQDWSAPYWDDQHMEQASALLEPAEALLLGRATYDNFAQAWPQRSGDPYTDKINAMPKYVASRTLQGPSWNATVLGEDVAGDVAAVKARTEGDLLKFGTGELDRTLLENDLLDELHLWVFPVIVGSGPRVLDGVVPTTHLLLLGTTPLDSGIVIHRYGPKRG